MSSHKLYNTVSYSSVLFSSSFARCLPKKNDEENRGPMKASDPVEDLKRSVSILEPCVLVADIKEGGSIICFIDGRHF